MLQRCRRTAGPGAHAVVGVASRAATSAASDTVVPQRLQPPVAAVASRGTLMVAVPATGSAHQDHGGGAKVLSMPATPAARRVSAKHVAVSTLVALEAVGHMMITDPLYPCFFTMFLLLMCWSARLRNNM